VGAIGLLDMVKHIKLPQRVGTVNQLAVQLGSHGLGLAHRHGRADGADMACDVKLSVFHPNGVA
jgi:hypothetical protein